MTQKDAPTPAAAETITPLRVPKKMPRGDENLKRRYLIGTIALLGAIAGLIATGGWLLSYLAKNPQPSPIATPQHPADEPAVQDKSTGPIPTLPPPAVDPAQLALNKDKAEKKLAEFLSIKEVLDRKAASAWGAAAYTAMSASAREADTHLVHEEFLPAADKYEQATSIAQRLNDRTAAALQRLLAEGQDALRQGQAAQAQKKFNVALLIDPTDVSAQKGLKRAQTIEAVVQLMNSGRQHESDQALSAALADYRQALKIDPDAAEVRQALNRVTAIVNDQQFNQLMSQGLTALHKNDYQLAHARLLEARSLKPGSREVSDALLQVDQALRLARIDRLRHEARLAAQSEQWQRALDSYVAALAVDSSLQFAVRGKKQAEEQIHIERRLNFFISQPRALELDKQLNNAVLLLNEAQAVEPQGPKLAGRIKKLAQLVALARTPVTVIIESDNLTQVAVYRVGKLGRFSRHELKLRPGTYTVVGARDGYQDVRQQIVVKAGQPLLRVTVECRAKI